MIKRGAKGQMKISFGMIFAIILMVVFILVGVFGAKKFIQVNDDLEAANFQYAVQEEINELLGEPGSSQQEIFPVPDDVEEICFQNQPTGSKEYNFYSVPEGIIQEVLDSVNWGFTTPSGERLCIPVENGEVSLLFLNIGGDSVGITRGGEFTPEEIKELEAASRLRNKGGSFKFGNLNVIYFNDFEHHSVGRYTSSMYNNDWDDIEELHGPVYGSVSIYQNPSDSVNPTKVLDHEFQGEWACNGNSCITLEKDLKGGYNELYFSYKVKYGPGFETGRAKLPRLGGDLVKSGGAGVCPTGYDGFSAVYEISSEGSSIDIHNYVYHANQWNQTFYRDWMGKIPKDCQEVCDFVISQGEGENGCGVYGEGNGWFDTKMNKGEWYTFTQRVVLNDLGDDNGFVETFIDGKFVNHMGGLLFTKTEDLDINTLYFAMYATKEPYPDNVDVYFDDIIVYYYDSGQPVGVPSPSNRVLPTMAYPNSAILSESNHNYFPSSGGSGDGGFLIGGDNSAEKLFPEEYRFVEKDENDYSNIVYIEPGDSLEKIFWKSNTAYLFKRGETYKINDYQRIIIPKIVSNVYLGSYGSGENKPIIMGNVAGNGAFSIEADKTYFRDLDIQNHLGTVLYFRGNSHGSVVYECEVHNSGGIGVFFWSDGGKVLNSEIYDIYLDGIWGGSLEYIEIGYNHIYDVNTAWHIYGKEEKEDGGVYAGGDGLQFDNGDDSGVHSWWVHHNIFDRTNSGNKFGFIASGVDENFGILEYNIFKGPRTDGHGGASFFIGANSGESTSKGIVIRYNHFLGPSPHGIWNQVDGVIVEGNLFEGLDKAISNWGREMELSKNIFRDNEVCLEGKGFLGDIDCS